MALLVGVAAFALVFATVLGFLHGPFLLGDSEAESTATSFEFRETNVTAYEIGSETIDRALVVSYHSGHDHPQEAVTIEINGVQAFAVDRESGIHEPWNDDDGTISDASAQVVLYENRSDDSEGSDGEQYATIEEGDIVEVVWYEPGGNRMNVLQRYVVEGE